VTLQRISPARLWPIMAVLAAIWLLALGLGGPSSPQDRAVFALFFAQEHSWLVELAWWVTGLGDWLVLVPLALGVALYLFLRHRQQEAMTLIVAASLVRLLATVQKEVFDRARPGVEHWMMETSASFPSAHSANSAATYLAIALLLGGKRAVLAGAALLTLVVGMSRMVLGVHWPSDVIGGWAFGSAIALIVVLAGQRWSEGLARPDRA